MRAIYVRVRGKQSGPRAFAVGFLALVSLGWVCGCSMISPWAWMQPKDHLYDKELSATYDRTQIKKSLTLDVLPKIGQSKGELLSQSDSVVASLGRSKDGYKTWFTMVAFHEYELSVIRKYFYVVDERVENRARRGLRFDCEMLLGEEDLAKIRASKGSRQIALLEGMLENLHKDIAELAGDIDAPVRDNTMLDINVLLIKQVFNTVLRDLDKSPVLATRLGDPNGVEFDHINFGRGKIQMRAGGNIAVVKIRLGALLPTFDNLPEAAVVERVAQPFKAQRPYVPESTQ